MPPVPIVAIDWKQVLETVVALAGVGVAASVLYLLVSRVAVRMVMAAVTRTRSTWDDVLVSHRPAQRLALIVPALVVRWGIDRVPHLPPDLVDLVHRAMVAAVALGLARALSALLSGVLDLYNKFDGTASRPIKSYVQVAQLLVYSFAGIYAISALANESPWYLLTGLGAMTAVLLVIFRDTLLSLVAGIQLTSNDLLRVGDWIEMPNFGADGYVIDIALNAVKVQNWDRTVTVIPAHKFLEHSFKNWRAMFDAGGRRIKRSLHLDMTTVRFLTDEEIDRLSRVSVLHEYIEGKREELNSYNASIPEGRDVLINKRWLTNIGTLRAYVSAYLRAHPQIHKEFTFLVRQLQPTEHGLPLEIYVFTTDTRWAYYEGIQADVFDHLLAILPEFGLKVFQDPTGADIARLAPAEPTTP